MQKFLKLFLILFLFPFFAEAAVYKCPNEKGTIVFSDKPCEDALRKDGNKWINVEEEKRQINEKKRQLEEEKRKRDAEIIEASKAFEQQQRRVKQILEQERANKIAQAKANGQFFIEYTVSGSALQASLTFNNQSSGTEQHKVWLPWTYSMVVSKGYFAYISAQNQSSYGSVIVKILLNGTEVKSSESTGEYGIASASGKV